MSRVELSVGQQKAWTINLGATRVIPLHRAKEPTAIADLSAAVKYSLEHPLHFEALRRALTPDDRITLVVDDRLPSIGIILSAVLKYLVETGIRCEQITLLSPPGEENQSWIDQLPDEYQDVQTEIHDPSSRSRCCYLASSKKGERIYLNRTLVESDQSIILTGRGYDSALGYSGTEGMIFPRLGDEEIISRFSSEFHKEPPTVKPFPIREQAIEVAWLLGAPFFVQIIEGYGDTISSVESGLINSSPDTIESLNQRWRVEVDEKADLVLATITGDPNRLGFSDLARAVSTAARITHPQGKIILLTEMEIKLTSACDHMAHFDEPEDALDSLLREKPIHYTTAYEWALAASKHRIYLDAELSQQQMEGIFAEMISKPSEVERLLAQGSSCIILPDAHKTMAICRSR